LAQKLVGIIWAVEPQMIVSSLQWACWWPRSMLLLPSAQRMINFPVSVHHNPLLGDRSRYMSTTSPESITGQHSISLFVTKYTTVSKYLFVGQIKASKGHKVRKF